MARQVKVRNHKKNLDGDLTEWQEHSRTITKKQAKSSSSNKSTSLYPKDINGWILTNDTEFKLYLKTSDDKESSVEIEDLGDSFEVAISDGNNSILKEFKSDKLARDYAFKYMGYNKKSIPKEAVKSVPIKKPIIPKLENYYQVLYKNNKDGHININVFNKKLNSSFNGNIIDRDVVGVWDGKTSESIVIDENKLMKSNDRLSKLRKAIQDKETAKKLNNQKLTNDIIIPKEVINILKSKYKNFVIDGYRELGDFDSIDMKNGMKHKTFIFDDYDNKVYEIKDKWKKFSISLNRQEIKNLKLVADLNKKPIEKEQKIEETIKHKDYKIIIDKPNDFYRADLYDINNKKIASKIDRSKDILIKKVKSIIDNVLIKKEKPNIAYNLGEKAFNDGLIKLSFVDKKFNKLMNTVIKNEGDWQKLHQDWFNGWENAFIKSNKKLKNKPHYRILYESKKSALLMDESANFQLALSRNEVKNIIKKVELGVWDGRRPKSAIYTLDEDIETRKILEKIRDKLQYERDAPLREKEKEEAKQRKINSEKPIWQLKSESFVEKWKKEVVSRDGIVMTNDDYFKLNPPLFKTAETIEYNTTRKNYGKKLLKPKTIYMIFMNMDTYFEVKQTIFDNYFNDVMYIAHSDTESDDKLKKAIKEEKQAILDHKRSIENPTEDDKKIDSLFKAGGTLF